MAQTVGDVADYVAAWSDVHGVNGDAWNGGFAYTQLDVLSAAGNLALVMTPTHAADAEGAIRAGYLHYGHSSSSEVMK